MVNNWIYIDGGDVACSTANNVSDWAYDRGTSKKRNSNRRR